MKMETRVLRAMSLSVGLLLTASKGWAVPFTYTIGGDASGQLGDTPFATTAFTFRIFADTSSIFSDQFFTYGPASFSIEGVATGNFPYGLQLAMAAVPGTVILQVADNGTGVVLFDMAGDSLRSYGLGSTTSGTLGLSLYSSNMGPPCTSCVSVHPDTPYGPLSMVGIGNLTFSAQAGPADVPEPTTNAPLVLALVALGMLRRGLL
jgi:hypothetical protein